MVKARVATHRIRSEKEKKKKEEKRGGESIPPPCAADTGKNPILQVCPLEVGKREESYRASQKVGNLQKGEKSRQSNKKDEPSEGGVAGDVAFIRQRTATGG